MTIKTTTSIIFSYPDEFEQAQAFREQHPGWRCQETSVSMVCSTMVTSTPQENEK